MAKVAVDFDGVKLAAGLVVRPGDTLILLAQMRHSMAEVEELRARLAERLPGVPVVVLEGFEQAAVYRPGENGGGDG